MSSHDPTATQSAADGHDTALNVALRAWAGSGTFWTVQPDPPAAWALAVKTAATTATITPHRRTYNPLTAAGVAPST